MITKNLVMQIQNLVVNHESPVKSNHTLPGDVLLVGEFIDFMILSKGVYVSSSQRLKSSLDIFFLLGILLRNSVVAALEVVSLV